MRKFIFLLLFLIPLASAEENQMQDMSYDYFGSITANSLDSNVNTFDDCIIQSTFYNKSDMTLKIEITNNKEIPVKAKFLDIYSESLKNVEILPGTNIYTYENVKTKDSKIFVAYWNDNDIAVIKKSTINLELADTTYLASLKDISFYAWKKIVLALILFYIGLHVTKTTLTKKMLQLNLQEALPVILANLLVFYFILFTAKYGLVSFTWKAIIQGRYDVFIPIPHLLWNFKYFFSYFNYLYIVPILLGYFAGFRLHDAPVLRLFNWNFDLVKNQLIRILKNDDGENSYRVKWIDGKYYNLFLPKSVGRSFDYSEHSCTKIEDEGPIYHIIDYEIKKFDEKEYNESTFWNRILSYFEKKHDGIKEYFGKVRGDINIKPSMLLTVDDLRLLNLQGNLTNMKEWIYTLLLMVSKLQDGRAKDVAMMTTYASDMHKFFSENPARSEYAFKLIEKMGLAGIEEFEELEELKKKAEEEAKEKDGGLDG
ncbi:hypothetical protein HNP88_000373 [Methanococcus maripaludis]|uniref:Uncharacterized protein n=1 Tax=Methanococcus maripaludis TaxID=39152 RepID=A0A7J9NMD0_METMI|nr:hypothetical protein [Methanococcus maripaludis]MBA2846189.1 hypothetical protein [Methanococcus maripaludis]